MKKDLVEGNGLVTSRFGEWPSFHDAEIVRLHLDRNNGLEPSGPILTLWIYVFKSQFPPDDPNRLDSLLELKFQDIDRFQMSEFNHQNAISSFEVEEIYSERLLRLIHSVTIKPGFGISCAFECGLMEVVSINSYNTRWPR
jgi:hypothetical protein